MTKWSIESCFSYIRIAWKSSRLFQTLLKGFTSRVLSLEASNIDTSLDGCFSRKANFLWNLSISCHTTHCKAKQSNSDLLEPTLHVSLGCGSFGNGRVASAKVCRRFAKKQRFGVSVFILLGFLQTSYQYLVCQNDALTSDWSELHVFKWGRQVENLEWTNKPVKYMEKRFVICDTMFEQNWALPNSTTQSATCSRYLDHDKVAADHRVLACSYVFY